MRRSMVLWAVCWGVLGVACTNRHAAMLGAGLGAAVGRPVGVVLTAVEEAVHTTHDVVQANPRHDGRARQTAGTGQPAEAASGGGGMQAPEPEWWAPPDPGPYYGSDRKVAAFWEGEPAPE